MMATPVAEAYAEKDLAIDMVGEQACPTDPTVAAQAVRKIDWFLIPAMTVGASIRSPTKTHGTTANMSIPLTRVCSMAWSIMTK